MSERSEVFEAAPMDSGTKIISAVFTVALFTAGIVGFAALTSDSHPSRWIILAMVLVPVIAVARSPRTYQLGDSTLTIRSRWTGSRTFHVTDARATTGKLETLGLRLIGNGGPFGWTGTFTFPQRGRAQLYVTNRERIVWFDFPDGRPSIGVSPRDPDAMVSGWRRSKDHGR